MALLNNILETRIDSLKILSLSRRAVPLGCPNIGAWYKVFNLIGTVAVITNTLLSVFAFQDVDELTKSSTQAKIWTFIVAEVGLFLYSLSNEILACYTIV
jgi:hypothetical protein